MKATNPLSTFRRWTGIRPVTSYEGKSPEYFPDGQAIGDKQVELDSRERKLKEIYPGL